MCQSFTYGVKFFLQLDTNGRSSHTYKGEAQIDTVILRLTENRLSSNLPV